MIFFFYELSALRNFKVALFEGLGLNAFRNADQVLLVLELEILQFQALEVKVQGLRN